MALTCVLPVSHNVPICFHTDCHSHDQILAKKANVFTGGRSCLETRYKKCGCLYTCDNPWYARVIVATFVNRLRLAGHYLPHSGTPCRHCQEDTGAKKKAFLLYCWRSCGEVARYVPHLWRVFIMLVKWHFYIRKLHPLGPDMHSKPVSAQGLDVQGTNIHCYCNVLRT